jgi:hypothetical protein
MGKLLVSLTRFLGHESVALEADPLFLLRKMTPIFGKDMNFKAVSKSFFALLLFRNVNTK